VGFGKRIVLLRKTFQTAKKTLKETKQLERNKTLKETKQPFLK
jgi:hypothetical protein